MYEIPLIIDPKNKLAYAHHIARTANGHTQYALPMSEINTYDEPKEAMKYAQSILGKDMLLEEGNDYSELYRGHGPRSQELSAALNIAICVFSHKMVEIYAEKNIAKLQDLKRQFGLVATFPDDDINRQEEAKATLFLPESAVVYLQNSENRENMRQRFPDAKLTDDMIAKFTPQSSTPAATPTPAI